MRRLRRIKILATLGPASSDSAMIRKLFEAGADLFRINMSHTSHDTMRELVKTIRNVESSYGRPIGILVDLQGPNFASDPLPRARFSSRTAKASYSIPARHRATTPASSSRIRKFWPRCGPATRCCSTTARCA